MKIRRGDTVVVISGKDKGRTGTVMRVLLEKGRLVVSGINMRTKHIRATSQRAGQIVKYEASLHVSNVMYLDPKTKKPTRVGFVVDEKGKRRIAKRSGEVIVAKELPKELPKEEEQKKGKKTEGEGAPEEAPKHPSKKPFWQRLGFGSHDFDEAAQERGLSPNQKQNPDKNTYTPQARASNKES